RTLFEGLIGNGLVAHELLTARVVGFGEGEIGLRLHKIRARLIERVLERPLVDREEQIALLDELSILEVNFVEISRNARPNLDGIYRRESTDIFVVVDDGALHRLRDRDRRRRRAASLLLLLATTCNQSRKRKHGRGPARATHQRK